MHRREHDSLEDSQGTDDFHSTLDTCLICLIDRVETGCSKGVLSLRRLVESSTGEENGM